MSSNPRVIFFFWKVVHSYHFALVLQKTKKVILIFKQYKCQILKRRFKSQVQHICSQLKKLGVFIESLDFFNSQLESTQ